MSASMNIILIIGGTTGIGLACAKRFHSMGKKVIITGRPNAERLASIEKSVPGVSTYGMDVTDLDSLPGHVEQLFKQFPNIDTVWINAGIQQLSSIANLNSTTDAKYISEITINITAPFILTRHIIPRLLALKDQGKEGNLMITGSGLGFVPNGKTFPVYCATKAAVHTYLVGIRQALKDTNVNIIEPVPPYVEGTELGPEHKEMLRNVKGMALDEYVDETFQILDSTPAKELKEVAAGSGRERAEAWASGVRPLMNKMWLSD
jgi:uncharacterized oxidoreductase